MDFALIAQAATLRSRVPFIHFFDGFRTSHEVMKIQELHDDDLRALIDDRLVYEHRARGLSPEHPVMRGSAQNPDVFFQAREAVNPYYAACPRIVEETMAKFAAVVGRSYALFQYYGSPTADRLMIMMGSGAETAQETVDALNAAGEGVGLLKVRLYRPFSIEHFLKAIPPTVRAIAVLDRTKEPGSTGEPLYVDVVSAFSESFAAGVSPLKAFPKIIGGRYGLSSKEFTPAMVKSVYDELKRETPRNHFTVGIEDDVSGTHLPFDPAYTTEPDDVMRALFYGLGADGTVSANKNSIKIIGEDTSAYAQGYFVYDSKKSGSTTISHLRFGPQPIHSTYLIRQANFVACHQWFFLERYNVLENIVEGGTFLLNSVHSRDTVWEYLPRSIQSEILTKHLKFYVIDASEVARQTGMGGRINTVMQTCFFAISGVLPKDDAIAAIKRSIEKTYGKKGEDIVRQNFNAVDQTIANLFEVTVPAKLTSIIEMPPTVSPRAPEYVRTVTAPIIAGHGDALPVSAMPPDGTFPVGTARWEKRNIALEVPVWEPSICIQCNKCVIVCPHATIRVKAYEPALLNQAPATFKSMDYKGSEYKGWKYTIQVGVEDCTGCGLCVDICPARSKSENRIKAINMAPQPELRTAERINYDFFLGLPEVDRRSVKIDNVKASQFFEPLFEYSGACSGCGETPYVKLVSQLYGDRAVIANATGCSSIYGGNLPTTPWTANADGRGPAWSNSLFEDNAEFGLGIRLAIDKHTELARELVRELAPSLDPALVAQILDARQENEADIYDQRERVALLKQNVEALDSPRAKSLLTVADNLVKRSVWIMGGDGWAYDIGYGGLDHVLASGKNVNVLVLDTEVYSNTGGQTSKSTPRSAVAKFSAAGKTTAKKDLALLAMTYGNVYVAKVAMGSNDAQTLRAIVEAEAYNGPSLIIAYSHCIAHGINMTRGMQNQKVAVDTGYWPLFRFNPDLGRRGENPFKLDSKAPKLALKNFTDLETRFKMLEKSHPAVAKELARQAQEDVSLRWKIYEELAHAGKETNGNGNT
jgi:pyruvate-ferredoxin/flavodoxin oxidoreductase